MIWSYTRKVPVFFFVTDGIADYQNHQLFIQFWGSHRGGISYTHLRFKQEPKDTEQTELRQPASSDSARARRALFLVFVLALLHNWAETLTFVHPRSFLDGKISPFAVAHLSSSFSALELSISEFFVLILLRSWFFATHVFALPLSVRARTSKYIYIYICWYIYVYRKERTFLSICKYICWYTIYIYIYRKESTARSGQPGQDKENRIVKAGHPERDRQNRTGRERLPGQDF
jgi:hypothetical protein